MFPLSFSGIKNDMFCLTKYTERVNRCLVVFICSRTGGNNNSVNVNDARGLTGNKQGTL